MEPELWSMESLLSLKNHSQYNGPDGESHTTRNVKNKEEEGAGAANSPY